MSNNPWLEQRVFPRKKRGDVGIELEVEGCFNVQPSLETYWHSKEEHSLRDGVEFVLKRPIMIGDLKPALADLDDTLNNSEVHYSIRCSTHIHVNISSLTTRQVYNIALFYYLIEDLLVQTQGPLRIGNLFCLRMSDAEGVAHDMYESIKRGYGFQYFSMDANKYGALNLAAVKVFGSLEFRFFRPLKSAQIEFWTLLLHRMVQKAKDIDAGVFLNMINRGEYFEAMNLVLSSDQIAALIEGQPDWIRHLDVNYDPIKRINRELNKVQTFRMPDHIVETDDWDDSPDDPAQPAPTAAFEVQPTVATTDELFPPIMATPSWNNINWTIQE